LELKNRKAQRFGGRKMKVELQNVLPEEIEKRSFEIIVEELGEIELDPLVEPVLKRVIHTTADFEYVKNLTFSEDAIIKAMEALKKGAVIVTDTQMAKAGINKATLEALGGEACCFMADEDVAAAAKANGTTRATASMDKAAKLDRPLIFAVGNAPTALVRIYELVKEGRLKPELIIGVPVGFVNVVESKELILELDIPYIVARGRKGGSNVAAAICNALLYQCKPRG
jgi:precorrin-8X/cobalt-precorrin-8 methylmutase